MEVPLAAGGEVRHDRPLGDGVQGDLSVVVAERDDREVAAVFVEGEVSRVHFADGRHGDWRDPLDHSAGVQLQWQHHGHVDQSFRVRGERVLQVEIRLPYPRG